MYFAHWTTKQLLPGGLVMNSIIKSERLLKIYSKLVDGKVLPKKDLAQRYNVSERSIQRDMESLRNFFAEQNLQQDIIYDRRAGGYMLRHPSNTMLSNSEILGVCKILLESCSLRSDEMLPILDKLIECCVPEESKKSVSELLANEKLHYVQPHHKMPVVDRLWELGQAVQQNLVIEMDYQRFGGDCVRRVVEPVGIMFSEYYFYLAAYIRNIDRAADFNNFNDNYPTIYRIDRIKDFRLTDEHFYPKYADRFQEGEFRNRVQFMYTGALKTRTFKFSGPAEVVFDRLPTAEIIDEQPEYSVFQAEVFGDGIDMWLRSQGDMVEVLE
jgi:predicted DNA-binding transcriptional regulator YafY